MTEAEAENFRALVAPLEAYDRPITFFGRGLYHALSPYQPTRETLIRDQNPPNPWSELVREMVADLERKLEAKR